MESNERGNDQYPVYGGYPVFLHFVIFTILFVGPVIYSLSDLPAVFLCLLAEFEVEHIVEDVTSIKILVRSILFGILVYSAYNVRTVLYVFFVSLRPFFWDASRMGK